MTLRSQWDIAEIIENFLGSVDTFREEVYALEGDSFPSWWAKQNPELSTEQTSLHEFVYALRLVGELDFRFARNANLLAQLSRDTYPHVPELVPIEQLLCALSSGSAVELYAWDREVGPTWQALLTLTNAGHFSANRVDTRCYYVDMAEQIVKEQEDSSSMFDNNIEDIPRGGPFSAERVNNPGPLSLPEYFDSSHHAETIYDPCPCVFESKPRYHHWFDDMQIASIDPAPPFLEVDEAQADREELLRVLGSKGVSSADAEDFLNAVSFGDIVAIEDATWVSSPNSDRQLVDADGFTLRLEPTNADGFDEAITLRFRRGLVKVYVQFKVASASENRMSWGRELSDALAALTALAEADTASPREGRIGVNVRLDYAPASNIASVTVFGDAQEPTVTHGPYANLGDAARAASMLARRALR